MTDSHPSSTVFLASILLVVVSCWSTSRAEFYCAKDIQPPHSKFSRSPVGEARVFETPIFKSTSNGAAPAFTDCAAYGEYNTTANQTGWNVLTITSNASRSDDVQAYMVGFLEGYVTAADVVNFHENTLGPQGSFGPVNQKIRDWIIGNDEWMQAEAFIHKDKDPRWAHVYLILEQVQGMIDGIQAAGFNYTREQFMLSLSMPDIVSDLQVVYTDPRVPPLTTLQRLHCSSLVKVTDDLSDLYFAHATWMNYNTMLRVFKTITLHFTSVPLPAKTIYFSSYPGSIASTDDFYTLSSGLGVMETSFSIFNTSLYSVLTPESLVSSIRSTLANRLSKNGEEWGPNFGFKNSGTYNNQWIIVNMNRFEPGVGLQSGTLWIVEQLPGYIESSDQTLALSFGYWPSYNVPISKKLYNLAGYAQQAPDHPNFDSYQNTVRAKLFRELQGKIKTVEDLKYVMQYNQYQTNPTELQNPLYAIASRGDKITPVGQGFGAIDCKITAYSEFMLNPNSTNTRRKVHAFSGPTPQQGPFDFTTSNATGLFPNAGVPLFFNFTWQTYGRNY
jgi:hypothetical protein